MSKRAKERDNDVRMEIQNPGIRYFSHVVQYDFYFNTTRKELITVAQITTTKHHTELTTIHCVVIYTLIILSLHVYLSPANHGNFPGKF